MYSNKLICNILIYIESNITNNININDLEKTFFYNRYYIMKLFKKELKMTVIEYINKRKIYNSILDIKNNNKSLLYISLRNGFNSLEYYSEITKKYTDISPIKYRYYFYKQYKLSVNEFYKITDVIVELHNIILFKDNYLSNQVPESTKVKKLSLFKK